VQPVLTVTEMQAVDARAQADTPLEQLVERAGTAVAGAALELMGGAYGRRAVLICGKGNNGADGRVAARLLAGRGVRVTVVAPGEVDALGMSGPPVDLVVDAAFGTGFRGAYDAPRVAPGIPVLAVDIPSGVEGDTGRATGTVLPATATVTFVALKPGLVQGDGATLAGEVRVVDIGLPVGPHRVDVVDDGDVADLVPDRDPGGNKWVAAVLVVAGSPGMTGAAALSARAAYRAGAGMVRLGVPGGDPDDLPAAEAVGITLPAVGWADVALSAADRCHAVVVGPGLGRGAGVGAEVRSLVASSPVPVVVDADGLFALGRLDGVVATRSPVVLTPHDGEYARLCDSPPGPDRIAAARRLAAAAGMVALVKGPTTAVADPSGRVLLARSGTPSLATAGTGDVLSGVIGALLARGVPPLEAAALGAHLHGRAGALGHRSGLVAGDLPDLVARVLDAARRS
jgi:ADP-dependent NAD(P)H-hydrate dehydratase / NAD(P)H-hydrate epimerase